MASSATTYGTVDMQVISDRLNEVLQGSATDVQRLQRRVQDAEMASKLHTTSGVLRAQTQDTQDKMVRFQASTDVLAQMNEAYNANAYIMGNLVRETGRVARLDADARKEMWKARQRYLATQYQLAETRFRRNVVLSGAALTLVILVLAAAWRQGRLWGWLFAALVGLLVLAYGVGLALAMRRNASRRKLHWRQFYWRVSGDAANETNKSNAASASCS